MHAGKGLSDFPVPFEGVFLFDGVATTASDPMVIMLCLIQNLHHLCSVLTVGASCGVGEMYVLHRTSKTTNHKIDVTVLRSLLCNGVDSAR